MDSAQIACRPTVTRMTARHLCSMCCCKSGVTVIGSDSVFSSIFAGEAVFVIAAKSELIIKIKTNFIVVNS